MLSPISTLPRVGIYHQAYSHVESFRRQVHVNPPDDSFILPASTTIILENTQFKNFFSFDELTCFVCKQKGHSSNNCISTSKIASLTQSLQISVENSTLLKAEPQQTQDIAIEITRHLCCKLQLQCNSNPKNQLKKTS